MANATIINNAATAEQNILRIDNPILYTPDPDKNKALPFAQWFFGLVGRDPTVAENQKLVYALQEDGSAVSIQQPVVCSAGGVPFYNGSPVSLAVSGSYSFTALDSNDVPKYVEAEVVHLNAQGFSGVIAEESQTVAGSLTLTYAIIEATTASFYISQDALGVEFKGEYLRAGLDYIIVDATTITLQAATADGFVVLGREADPTGQIVPVSEGSSALVVFQDIAIAKNSDLKLTDTVTINGGVTANDGLGGNKYITVAGGTGTADDENYIDLNNGLQLEAVKNIFKLSRYAETTNSPVSGSGTLSLDLEGGNVFKTVLSENLSNILFVNVNADVTLTTTVTLKITQDAAVARTISWPGTIKWAGGTAPTMTATLSAHDRFVFVTDDGGVTWDGAVMGQDFS